MWLVLKKLLQYKLYVNLNKCEFSVIQIIFLDFFISVKDIEMNFNKIEIMKNWFESITHKKVQTCLSMTNFYRRFIKDFSRIARDLTDILQNDVKRKFSNSLKMILKARIIFEILKKAFITASMLRHFDSKKKIKLKTDTSEFVISEIISQLQKDTSQWHSIAY
jgi:hypothetical protein